MNPPLRSVNGELRLDQSAGDRLEIQRRSFFGTCPASPKRISPSATLDLLACFGCRHQQPLDARLTDLADLVRGRVIEPQGDLLGPTEGLPRLVQGALRGIPSDADGLEEGFHVTCLEALSGIPEMDAGHPFLGRWQRRPRSRRILSTRPQEPGHAHGGDQSDQNRKP